MTDKVKDSIEDVMTGILRTMVKGTITGVLVDFDKHTGEKYYGLRIRRYIPYARKPPYSQEFALWFLADEEGNGPGGFQIQEIKEELTSEFNQELNRN